MTYDEKVAYRVKHGIPSTIDEWIAAGKMRTEAPTANPFKRGSFGDYPLWQDDVECILNVIREVGIQLRAATRHHSHRSSETRRR